MLQHIVCLKSRSKENKNKRKGKKWHDITSVAVNEIKGEILKILSSATWPRRMQRIDKIVKYLVDLQVAAVPADVTQTGMWESQVSGRGVGGSGWRGGKGGRGRAMGGGWREGEGERGN